jgi:hypothetical protein
MGPRRRPELREAAARNGASRGAAWQAAPGPGPARRRRSDTRPPSLFFKKMTNISWIAWNGQGPRWPELTMVALAAHAS